MWILAQILTEITGKPRYFPDLEWNKTSIVDNFFIAFYKIFGRRVGIKIEVTAWKSKETEGRAFHTWRSALIYAEHCLHSFFKGFTLTPFKVYIPILCTPQGIPIFTSSYLFAIAWVTPEYENTTGGTGVTLTVSSVVVASGNVLFAFVQTYQSNTNTPITSVKWNTSENLTQIGNKAINPSTRMTGDIWQIVTPTATTANVVAISSNVPNEFMYGEILVYSGANTAAVAGNFTSSNNTDNQPTITLSGTTSTSWGIAGCQTENVTASSGTNFTDRATINAAGDTNGTIGGSSITMSTNSINTGGGWYMVACELKIPSGGGTTTLPFRSLLGVGI